MKNLNEYTSKDKNFALTKEQLLSVWMDNEPTAKSPYGLYGNPPMWETLEFNKDLVMYSRPIPSDQSAFVVQFKRGDAWIGQGVQFDFDNFESRGLLTELKSFEQYGGLHLLGQKRLTRDQQYVLKVLREREAFLTADATERAWKHGEVYYLDTRNSARKGIVRLFNQGNEEAVSSVSREAESSFQP